MTKGHTALTDPAGGAHRERMATAQTWLIHLSPSECARRLTESTLGRLAVIVSGRPEVFPVNHVVDDKTGHVVFPTLDGTKLHGAVDWPWIGFEIDGVDPNGDGWSVMVVGRAEELTDAETIERVRSERTPRWVASGSERWLRIVPSKTTGRRIRAA